MLILTLMNRCRLAAPAFVLWLVTSQVAWGEPFDDDVLPIIQRHCIKCHGGSDVNGDVNLELAGTRKLFLKRTELIQEVLKVVEANDMPPEGESPLDASDRRQMIVGLKALLRESAAASRPPSIPTRRLNRLQYNYSVRDLFQLNRDIFPLPEKLMTRHDPYLHPPAEALPAVVRVASQTLAPPAGLEGVKAFPKDLRAAHGFDNQANQLTLSPLLLDAFLRLSVSIVDSPDFNEANVGIWSDFFAAPATKEGMQTEQLRKRLERFLLLTFRGKLDDATLDRYVAYVERKLAAGVPYTEAMKKAAAAALSSPLFIFRAGGSSSAAGSIESQLRLASDISYFLWSSGPDWELLQQARGGKFKDPQVLSAATRRMLKDPKIERFLDSFPAQWLQLENVLAATPDPRKQPLFHLDKSNPASLQMLLEPLLLFDAVFLENRPIVELLTPTFSYQSEFLNAWYRADLKPPTVDVAAINKANRQLDEKRERLQAALLEAEQALDKLLAPIRKQLLAERLKGGATAPLDLKPIAAWEFDGNLKDDVASLHLAAHGEVTFSKGAAVLNRSYLLSKPLRKALRAKSLEVWCRVPNLDQRGGGVMGIQGPGDFFDTIVLGERKPRHWISGSNGHTRTKDFPGSTPETVNDDWLHLVMVYQANGETQLYRNGKVYGMPYSKGAATFPAEKSSVIFGLRHLPAGGNKFLNMSIDKARLYDRALTADEVAASHRDQPLITEAELVAALDESQRSLKASLERAIATSRKSLMDTPKNRDPNVVVQQTREAFENKIRQQQRSQTFARREIKDPRYGGVITNAATLSMTSGPTRTHPIARGAWIIEVIFNDPPPPPPNDVPPLNEDDGPQDLTIRERFAKHRESPDCAGCHSRLDPLGFALENFDIVGQWREKYENGREVDASGTMMRKHHFRGIVDFKKSLVQEERRFAKAFTAHLLRFALARELAPSDVLVVDAIVEDAAAEKFRLQSLIHGVVLSPAFQQKRDLTPRSTDSIEAP